MSEAAQGVLGLLFVAAVGFFIGAGLMNAYTPSEGEVLCAYEGGTPHGEVCVKDGTVLPLPKEVVK